MGFMNYFKELLSQNTQYFGVMHALLNLNIKNEKGIFIPRVSAILGSCQSTKSSKTEAVLSSNYPSDIKAVFGKHGGIKQ